MLKVMRTAYIALGSNLAGEAGSPEETLTKAVQRLESLGRMVGRSSLYSTAPVGFDHQPRFVNAVVALETALAPRALLTALLDLEDEFGRLRNPDEPKGPRTLDLDLLLLGDLRRIEPGLELPHPRMAERLFVLEPLAEIAPRQIIPMTGGVSVAELRDQLHADKNLKPDAVVRLASDLWESLEAVC